MAVGLQTTFSINVLVWMPISLNFVSMVQLTLNHHWYWIRAIIWTNGGLVYWHIDAIRPKSVKTTLMPLPKYIINPITKDILFFLTVIIKQH